jgi:diacylglycerol kinase (ATP)
MTVPLESFRPAPLVGDRILVAFNPIAGTGARRAVVAAVVASLQEVGFQVELLHDVVQLRERAQADLARQRLRGVIAAGGDGTISFLANELGPHVPFVLLPLGTENLLASYLGHTTEIESVARLFLSGRQISLDAGEADGRLFTLMAGCGFDADVVRRLHENRRGNIWRLSYVGPILDSLLSYSYPPLLVTTLADDGTTTSLSCCWAFVQNVPRYAVGLQLVPTASPLDGLLDVCTFKQGSLLAGLGYLYGVAVGEHLSWEGVECQRVRSVRIESLDPVPVQLDGDPAGELPMEFSCRPGGLRLIVSPEWLRAQDVMA